MPNIQNMHELNTTVYLKDVKAAGTTSGTFTQDAWQIRTLNTTENAQTWCSLSANKFTLSAGKYKIKAKVPAFAVNNHKAKLYNVTDASDEIYGSGGYTSASATVSNDAIVIEGIVEITSSKEFRIDHFCNTTKTINGFGAGIISGLGNEIYTQVEITKIG